MSWGTLLINKWLFGVMAALCVIVLLMRLCVNGGHCSFIYAIDSNLSVGAIQELQDTFSSLVSERGPSVAIQAMQARYPYLKDATCAYLPSQHAYVAMQVRYPHCLINNEKLLFDDGLLISKTVFQDDIVSALPAITISHLNNQIDILPAAMRALVMAIPSTWYTTYAIVWRGDHALCLYEKNRDDVFFVFDTQSVPDESMLAACQQVAQECRVTPSRKHCLVVDARFENQIIVYGDTGGYGHGPGIG